MKKQRLNTSNQFLKRISLILLFVTLGQILVNAQDVTPPKLVSNKLFNLTAANSELVDYVFTFDENVKNVDINDLVVTTVSGNATGEIYYVQNTKTIAGVFLHHVSGEGSIRIDLKDSTNIIDEAGNGNGNNGYVAAFTTGYMHTVDRIKPSVIISSSEKTTTNKTSIPVTVTFSEPISNFDVSDIQVNGGTVSNLQGKDAIYTFELLATQEGKITVDIDSNRVEDTAKNLNKRANQFSIVRDITLPKLISNKLFNPTAANSELVDYVFTFDENVKNVDINDLVVTTVSNATGEIYYVQNTKTIAGIFLHHVSGEGSIRIDLKDSTDIIDEAGNGNGTNGYVSSFTTGHVHTVDQVKPSVTISSSEKITTNKTSIPITVTFSEPVSNFEANDIKINGGTVNNLTGKNAIYTFELLATQEGEITVDIDSNRVEDFARNPNPHAKQFSIMYDITAPKVTINKLNTIDKTPELSGTIDDNTATISVKINDQIHTAKNNQDGTWTLAENTVVELFFGTYDVVVEATDEATNVGKDTTINELIISTITTTNKLKGSEVQVFPNPVQNRLTINFETNQSTINITLFDLHENAILTKEINNQLVAIIEVGELVSGLYIVLIETTDAQKFEKVQIQH